MSVKSLLEEEFDRSPFISLTDAVYNVIFKMANRQELLTGKRINVSTLARELNVSRTPVLAALERLEADGIIYTYDKDRYVSAFEPEEASQIHILRCKLEVTAICRTAELASKHEIKKLLSVNKELDNAYLSDDQSRVLELETEFHHLIVTLCRNSYLIKAYKDLLPHIQRCQRATLFPVKDAAAVNSQHDFISRALCFADPTMCADAMLYHLSTAPVISAQLKMLCKKAEPQSIGESTS